MYSDVDRCLSSVRTFTSSLLSGTFHLLSEPPRFFRVLSITHLSSKFTSFHITFLLAPIRHMVFFIKSRCAFCSGVATCTTLKKSVTGGIYFGVSSCGKGGRYLMGLSVMRLFLIPRLNIALRIFLYSFRVAGFFLPFRSSRILWIAPALMESASNPKRGLKYRLSFQCTWLAQACV